MSWKARKVKEDKKTGENEGRKRVMQTRKRKEKDI